MQPNKKANPDDKISAALSGQFASQSRRSFFYRLTKASFAVLGVAIAGEVPLFFVPGVKAGTPNPQDSTWIYCGMHGNACNDKCGTPTAGSYTWVQCCPQAVKCGTDSQGNQLWCTSYHCCSYTDICNKETMPTDCNTDVFDTPMGTSGPTSNIWCGSYFTQVGTILGSG